MGGLSPGSRKTCIGNSHQLDGARGTGPSLSSHNITQQRTAHQSPSPRADNFQELPKYHSYQFPSSLFLPAWISISFAMVKSWVPASTRALSAVIRSKAIFYWLAPTGKPYFTHDPVVKCISKVEMEIHGLYLTARDLIAGQYFTGGLSSQRCLLRLEEQSGSAWLPPLIYIYI